jgi:hypothetical protein
MCSEAPQLLGRAIWWQPGPAFASDAWLKPVAHMTGTSGLGRHTAYDEGADDHLACSGRDARRKAAFSSFPRMLSSTQ